jgi:serine phosphatase RsbU (regulator of sigma subunit)
LNAGHPHPYQISRDNGLTQIVSSGHILGQSSGSTFTAEVLELGEGDSILFYTDGLFENQGPLGDCLTKRNIISSLNREMNAHEVLESVLAKAQLIWGDNPAEDDVTLVAVTWNPKNQKSRAVA